MALIRCATFNVLRQAFAFTLVLVAADAPVSATTQVQFQVIHSFIGASEGASPSALIQGADGKLYGLTGSGGSYGQSTFFTMTPEGAVTVLHMFSSAVDGVAHPFGLIQGGDGTFYGLASRLAFQVTPPGTIRIVYTFPANLYEQPFTLIPGPDGNLYGATTTHKPGVEFGGGSVFQLTPSGLLTRLRWFSGDTDIPAGLTLGSDGNLYGTTYYGAFSLLGGRTAYKMTLDGNVTLLHIFDPYEFPYDLVEGADGNFYGFSCCSGSSGKGDIVRMTPGGDVTVVRSRRASEAGYASFFRARDGQFYGTFGETFFETTPTSSIFSIFKMTIDGTITILRSFPRTNGYYAGSLTQATDGTFYGTSYVYTGPTYGSGVAFLLRATVIPTATGDFDGDRKSDLTVFRPATGVWHVLRSSGGFDTDLAQQWGLPTDVPVPGDYDGDGKIDLAVYRPSTGVWYALTSSTDYTSFVAEQWGMSTDTPVPGDYDGDGRNDLALYRSSTGFWYIKLSATNYTTDVAYHWGLNTDTPAAGDYDGDGKIDLGVYRPSMGAWYILQSSTNYTTYLASQWGLNTDRVVPGDYDGDGKTDLAVYRPSTGYWYIKQSSTGYTTYVAYQWGVGTDLAVPADYDGDGRTDLALYRPSTGFWYILQSGTNYMTYIEQQWGTSTDIPIND